MIDCMRSKWNILFHRRLSATFPEVTEQLQTNILCFFRREFRCCWWKKDYLPHRGCPHTEGCVYGLFHFLTHQKISWHGRGVVIISLSLDGILVMDEEPLLTIYKLCDQYVSLGIDKCLVVLSKSYYSDLFGWVLCCQRSSMIDWDEFNFIYTYLYSCSSINVLPKSHLHWIQ